jgi:hypothetical protein
VDQRNNTVKEVLEARDRDLAILILLLRSRHPSVAVPGGGAVPRAFIGGPTDR